MLDEGRISITRNASPLIFSRSFVNFSPRGDVTLYQTPPPPPLPLTRDLRSLDSPLLRGVRFLLVSLMWHLNDRSLGFGDTVMPTGLQLPRLGCRQLLIPITIRVLHIAVSCFNFYQLLLYKFINLNICPLQYIERINIFIDRQLYIISFISLYSLNSVRKIIESLLWIF